MGSRADIGERVRAVRGDARKADDLVRDYLPFIRSETAKFLSRPPIDGVDDELGIAMFAFHEAALAYDRDRGAFMAFASRIIRNRLIDFKRRERRHDQVISLDQPDRSDEDDRERTLLDRVDSGTDEIGEHHHRIATRQEVRDFVAVLASHGLDPAEIAQNCPKQERTLAACRHALACARGNPELLEQVENTGKLPLAALAEGAGVERKTLERHRKYLMALLLAYTNGFDIIRGHLVHLDREGGDGA